MNLVNFVPRILIGDRFDGAVMGVMLAIPIGMLFMYLFVRMITKFPGQGFPEIFAKYLPGWLGKLILFLLAFVWFSASSVTLVGFMDVTGRYISPDVSPYTILIGFLAVVCLGARRSSESILYALEIILFIMVPLIVYMTYRAISSPYFQWDAVKQVLTYFWTAPTLTSVAAATYIFSGYANVVIFNRVFQKLRVRHYWAIALIGGMTAVMAMLAPVGFLGAEGAGFHVYPAFSTVDSLRIRYFIIERMIYIFYVVYLCLSLVNSIIHWHVAKEMVLGAIEKPVSRSQDRGPSQKKRDTKEWWILAFFSAAVMVGASLMDQFSNNLIGIWFLNMRLWAELLLLILLAFCVLRRRSRA
nr:GerAB/ArcD/ProY family transporter [Paenibacillus lemnae]